MSDEKEASYYLRWSLHEALSGAVYLTVQSPAGVRTLGFHDKDAARRMLAPLLAFLDEMEATDAG